MRKPSTIGAAIYAASLPLLVSAAPQEPAAPSVTLSPIVVSASRTTDASAQLAAHILNPKDNERILDACAAPGGKTGHLLELNSDIMLDALEYFPNRINKISQNLDRLQLKANIILGDAKAPEKWFKGCLYDKILIDAPDIFAISTKY